MCFWISNAKDSLKSQISSSVVCFIVFSSDDISGACHGHRRPREALAGFPEAQRERRLPNANPPTRTHPHYCPPVID